MAASVSYPGAIAHFDGEPGRRPTYHDSWHAAYCHRDMLLITSQACTKAMNCVVG